MTAPKPLVHWERDGKLLCGASMDVEDDRFLLDSRWDRHVTCDPCKLAAAALPKPAPSAEPDTEQYLKVFYADGKYVGVPLERLREALSRAGLAIVPAADVLTPEERKVLEAMDAIPDGTLDALLSLVVVQFSSSLTEALRTERAHRAAKDPK